MDQLPLEGVAWERYNDTDERFRRPEPEADPEMVGQQLAPHTRLPGFRSARSDYSGEQAAHEAKKLAQLSTIVTKRPTPSNYVINTAIRSDNNVSPESETQLHHVDDLGNLTTVGRVNWNHKTGHIHGLYVDEGHRSMVPNMLHAAHTDAISRGNTGPTYAQSLTEYSAALMQNHGEPFMPPHTMLPGRGVRPTNETDGDHSPRMQPEYWDDPVAEKLNRQGREGLRRPRTLFERTRANSSDNETVHMRDIDEALSDPRDETPSDYSERTLQNNVGDHLDLVMNAVDNAHIFHHQAAYEAGGVAGESLSYIHSNAIASLERAYDARDNRDYLGVVRHLNDVGYHLHAAADLSDHPRYSLHAARAANIAESKADSVALLSANHELARTEGMAAVRDSPPRVAVVQRPRTRDMFGRQPSQRPSPPMIGPNDEY